MFLIWGRNGGVVGVVVGKEGEVGGEGGGGGRMRGSCWWERKGEKGYMR